jgi:hypothetical protein
LILSNSRVAALRSGRLQRPRWETTAALSGISSSAEAHYQIILDHPGKQAVPSQLERKALTLKSLIGGQLKLGLTKLNTKKRFKRLESSTLCSNGPKKCKVVTCPTNLWSKKPRPLLREDSDD